MFPTWAKISVSSENCLYNFAIEKDGYTILWTDMKDLFQEKLNARGFTSKFAKLNEDLEDCDSSEGLKEIKSILNQPEKCEKVDVCHVENGLEIKMDWSSDGLPFSWTFNLQKQSSESFERNVTSALTWSIQVLLDQQNRLFRIIRDKDLEIEDYFTSGAKLSRKSLKTDWFEKEKFLTKNESFSTENSSMEVIAGEDVNMAIGKLNAINGNSEVDSGKIGEAATTTTKEVKQVKQETKQEKIIQTPPKRKPIQQTFKAKDGEKRKKANHLKKL